MEKHTQLCLEWQAGCAFFLEFYVLNNYMPILIVRESTSSCCSRVSLTKFTA